MVHFFRIDPLGPDPNGSFFVSSGLVVMLVAMTTPAALSSRQQTQLLPILALVLGVAMWGSTFAMQKDVLTRMNGYDFLGIRFAIAGIVAAAVFWKNLRRADFGTWRRGIILGLLYAAAQEVQTIGLALTSASVTGFLTGLYVVLTPVVVLLIFGVNQPRRMWFAVALAGVGLAVMSLRGFSIGFGETIVLASAVMYAFHVAYIERYVEGRDPAALTAIQMIALGVVCLAFAVPEGIDLPTGPLAVRDWVVIVYMAVGTGLISLLLQTWAQARMSATQAAVVMTGEPVFAAIFAVLLINETLTPRTLIGGGLIVGAMLLSQVQMPRRRRERSAEQAVGAA